MNVASLALVGIGLVGLSFLTAWRVAVSLFAAVELE